MGDMRTAVMSGRHRAGGFAVRRSVRPYLTSSVAVASAGILAAGLVAGPPEVSVARSEVRGMQLIAIALPSTTPRPAMPMNFVRNQVRSALSAIPASIGGADTISAVTFVGAVQASSPVKEVIGPTTQSKIDHAKEGQQVTNVAVASPDIITNPILRSIIVGGLFFVVIPAFWVIIIVTSAINVVLDALNLPLLPNVPDPPFGPIPPLETLPAASAVEAETVLSDPVVPQTGKIASSPERVRRSGMLSHLVLRATNEPASPTGRVEMDLLSDPLVPQTDQPAPSTAGVEVDPPSSDVVEHQPDITSASKPSRDAKKDSLRFAPKRRGRDISSLTSRSVQTPAESPAGGTSNEGQQPIGGGGQKLRKPKADNADGEQSHDQSSKQGRS